MICFTIGKPVKYNFDQSISALFDKKYRSAAAPIVNFFSTNLSLFHFASSLKAFFCISVGLHFYTIVWTSGIIVKTYWLLLKIGFYCHCDIGISFSGRIFLKSFFSGCKFSAEDPRSFLFSAANIFTLQNCFRLSTLTSRKNFFQGNVIL